MPGIDRNRVKSSFDRHAHEYDRYAIVQKRVLDRFIRLLPAEEDMGRILDIGCGTGALLQALAARYGQSHLVGMDIAFGMGLKAREKLSGNSRVSFIAGDAEHLPVSSSTLDLVVSTSTFQWLERLEPAFAELHRVLRPGGRFCFALFGSQTLQELRDSYRDASTALFGATPERTHRFKDVETAATALRHAGLEAEYLTSELEVEIHEDVPHLLRSVRRIGAGNAAPASGRGLAERRVMLEMMDRYRKNFGTETGIPATYEVIYGVGMKCR